MTALYSLLREIGTEAEQNAKRELLGSPQSILALLYAMLMPLVLNFQTGEERYHFIFQKDGSISLVSGLHEDPDVDVSADHAELVHILQNRDKARFKHAERTRRIKITARTFKGSLAVVKLRALFL